MSSIITDRLALMIDAQTAGAVTAIQALSKTSTDAAASEDRRAAASLKAAAADDKAAVSAAKSSLVKARAVGDDQAIAAAETEVAAAQEKATVSKAESAAASDALAASDLKAKAAALGLAEGTTQSAGGLKGVLTNLAGSFSNVEKGAIVAGAALEFKVIDDSVKKFEELGHQVLITQGTLGGTAQQASLLIGQLKDLSIDPDTAAKSLLRFGAALGDGTSKIGNFGIEVAKNKDGTTDLYGTLENLRQAYQDSTDATTKDAIAKQLGLRNAQALIPYLNLTAQQLAAINAQTKASGGILSQSDVENAHQLSIASAQIKQAFDGLEISIARGVVPALTQAEQTLKDILPVATKISDLAGKKVEGGIFGLAALPITLPLKGLIDSYDKLTGSTNTSATATAADQVAQQEAAAAADAATTSVKNLTSALEGEVNAQNKVYDNVYAVVDAREKLAQDQQKLGDLISAGGVDATQVASALSQMTSAERAATSAQQTETNAQEALNKARERATALDLAQAQNKVDLAGDAITAAKAAQQQAKEKLDQLLGSGTATAGDVAAAQADLKTKTDDVTKSVNDQAQAQVDLGTAKQKGTESDPAVQQAEQNLANARAANSQAISNEIDAYGKLVSAQQPAVGWQQQINDQRELIAKDKESVHDALQSQVDDVLALNDASSKLTASLQNDATALGSISAQVAALKAQGLSVGDIEALLGQGPGATAASAAPKPDPTGPGSAAGDKARSGPKALPAVGFGSLPLPGVNTGKTQGLNVEVHQSFHGYDPNQIARESAHAAAWSIRTTIPTVLPR